VSVFLNDDLRVGMYLISSRHIYIYVYIDLAFMQIPLRYSLIKAYGRKLGKLYYFVGWSPLLVLRLYYPTANGVFYSEIANTYYFIETTGSGPRRAGAS